MPTPFKLRYYRSAGFQMQRLPDGTLVNVPLYRNPVDYYADITLNNELPRLSDQAGNISRSLKFYDNNNNPNLIATLGSVQFTLNRSFGFDAGQDNINGSGGRVDITSIDGFTIYRRYSLQGVKIDLYDNVAVLTCNDVIEDLKTYIVEGYKDSGGNFKYVNLSTLINNVGRTLYGYDLWSGVDLGQVILPPMDTNFFEWFNDIAVYIPAIKQPMYIGWDHILNKVVARGMDETTTSTFIPWSESSLVDRTPEIVDGRDQVYNNILYKFAQYSNEIQYVPDGADYELYRRSIASAKSRTLNITLNHIDRPNIALDAARYIFRRLALPKRRVTLTIPDTSIGNINLNSLVSFGSINANIFTFNGNNINGVFLENGVFYSLFRVESILYDAFNYQYELGLREELP